MDVVEINAVLRQSQTELGIAEVLRVIEESVESSGRWLAIGVSEPTLYVEVLR